MTERAARRYAPGDTVGIDPGAGGDVMLGEVVGVAMPYLLVWFADRDAVEGWHHGWVAAVYPAASDALH